MAVMNPALILIDIQNDYFPGGAMELDGPEAAAAQAARLLGGFRRRGWPIAHVQHVSTRPGATFFLPDTFGVQIHNSVAPQPGEQVLVKHFPNAFRQTELHAHLQQVQADHLIFVGMMTHMCIDTSVRAACDLGYACTLAADACATRALTFEGHLVDAVAVQRAYLAALNGTFAKVQTAQAVCDSLRAGNLL